MFAISLHLYIYSILYINIPDSLYSILCLHSPCLSVFHIMFAISLSSYNPYYVCHLPASLFHIIFSISLPLYIQYYVCHLPASLYSILYFQYLCLSLFNIMFAISLHLYIPYYILNLLV